jgi:aspartyl-tRNA(Asn)/glutamyl-tRNA(Gln) amidotransferase subunit A
MPESVAFASISELGRKLRSRQITSEALAELFLERLKRLGPQFNAVVSLTPELAIEQARMADRELREGRDRGPLHGIPFGAKDLLATKGIPTSWGAAPYKDQLIDQDSTVIKRLRDAGAVLCAKLSMVEFAGGFGYKQANASFTGPGLNPWDKTCWSGGSSSGPGSAVGAGLVPFAIGTETWGSIMTPAGYCGIAGMRPTYGRVSRHGAMALSWTMDKIGPMCRTAEDCGIVLEVIAGPDPLDPTCISQPWKFERAANNRTFRFGLLDIERDRVQAEVLANFERAVEILKTLGTVEKVRLPDLPYSVVAATIISSEMSAVFEPFIRSGDVWELTAPEDRWGGYSNLVIPAKDYIHALRIRRRIQQEIDQVFETVDLIVTPTLNTESGPIDQKFSDWSRGFVSSELSGAANAAGLPALTVPSGFGERGLPTGIEFTARAFDENTILAAACAFQTRTEWHTRFPDVE